MVVRGDKKQKLQDKLKDGDRVEWYRTALAQVDRLLDEGQVPLKGFVFWTCISNFEWSNGYEGDFGVIYTTKGKDKPRSVKNSAKYLKDVFRNGLPINSTKWG